MKTTFFVTSLLFISNAIFASEEITPYKFTEQDLCHGMPSYDISQSCRFMVKRPDINAPNIVCYLSVPKKDNFPIAILCGGSSSKNNVNSIIHFHRYLLQEFLDLETAVLTVEQWGVDGNKVDTQEFFKHYTRSQRLCDHKSVIEHLKSNPPIGWNGKFIFLGASEGGPIVTTLTTEYSDITLATINWCGAGDWSWSDELWAFIEGMRKEAPWWLLLWDFIPQWVPFSLGIPKIKQEYDALMGGVLKLPYWDKEFMGMSYKYHADALTYPVVDYHKICTPFLVVAGAKDTIVHSCDAFVEKAKSSGANITYLRVPYMDHYIRNHPDVIAQSFEWLRTNLCFFTELQMSSMT